MKPVANLIQNFIVNLIQNLIVNLIQHLIMNLIVNLAVNLIARLKSDLVRNESIGALRLRINSQPHSISTKTMKRMKLVTTAPTRTDTKNV